jgi:hypothetical protein
MYSKLLWLSLIFFSPVLQSNAFCEKDEDTRGLHYDCGPACTGTPSCGKHDCGDVNDMCYCDCSDGLYFAKCRTTDLGFKWNNGIRLKNGSYALNGSIDDDNYYIC